LASSTWDTKELDAIERVIKSGRFTMGPNVAEFERRFATYVGSRFAVMVNSGSSANLLMVAALFYSNVPETKLSRGDEVIVPAVSWSTTYFPLYQYALKIKFVDIDLETLNFDLEQLAEAVSDRTRAILAVNLLGNPNRFDRIAEIIRGRDIRLLEDNCESLGATFHGRHAGTFGIMGSFSTFFSHHMSTMEGGMIVTDDEELYHILLSLRAHGWTRELPQFNHVCGRKSDDVFQESFRFVLPGYNVRPLEIEGAIGVEQLEKLPAFIAERRKNAKAFVTELADHDHLMIQQEIGESSWFGFSLIIRPGSHVGRPQLRAALETLGFECRPIVAGNFARSETLRFLDADVQMLLRNADHLDANGLFIGNHHYPMAPAISALSTLKLS
jgi:CDP-6-deoxy-D-xylo-4-hexulose-3-dehydrase